MHLDVGGHPLHSRSLSVTLAARGDGRADVHGVVLDLRKRGFVPVGSDLQPSGIVHLMQLGAVVDPATGRLESVAAAQPNVAFEAAAVTEGESCRDPIGNVQQLAGETCDTGWSKRVSAAMGGPRGCSHLLTLVQLVGSTVATALAADRERFGPAPTRRPSERIFRRDVIVDGHERGPGSLALALQTTDLHYAPAPPVAPSMARFAGEHEIRGLVEVDFARYAIAGLHLAERRRDVATLETAAWTDRDDVARDLVGLSLARGAAGALLARLGDAPQDRPILDGLLMLAPALIQCVAALSDGWPALAASGRWVVGMGGHPDSCYMWRAGGALQRARGDGEPPTA
jgi:hypothetical protein